MIPDSMRTNQIKSVNSIPKNDNSNKKKMTSLSPFFDTLFGKNRKKKKIAALFEVRMYRACIRRNVAKSKMRAYFNACPRTQYSLDSMNCRQIAANPFACMDENVLSETLPFTNTHALHAITIIIIPAAAVSPYRCKCARIVAMIISLLQHYPYRQYCAKRLRGKTLHSIHSYRHVDSHSAREQ